MAIRRIKPGPGQESVWDYPRPPRVENCSEKIKIVKHDKVIADTDQAKRVLETSHSPVYYIPPKDISRDVVIQNSQQSWCEWKGVACYFIVILEGRTIKNAAWAYPSPFPAFEAIRDHLAFYLHLMDGCFVGDEKVQSQAGGFYGGWVTSNIVGPFKGETGTQGW